jgi:hypothetical protein
MSKDNRVLRFDDMFKVEDGIAVPKSSKETTIPEIREIIIRSKGIPGDADGRKKHHAYKELLAVYYIADPRSQARKQGLSNNELLAYTKERCGLEPDWYPDDVVMRCIQMYANEIKNEISMKTLDDLWDSFKLADELILKMKAELQIEIKNQGISLARLNELSDSFTSLLTLSTKITAELEKLTTVKTNVAAAERKMQLGRGNQVVTSSMRVE